MFSDEGGVITGVDIRAALVRGGGDDEVCLRGSSLRGMSENTVRSSSICSITSTQSMRSYCHRSVPCHQVSLHGLHSLVRVPSL
ncbi:MAG: hypothetical protein MZV63_47575 [Marinilabiliales bacterium]|nr:hypothetical protein [Marinilabiliales bacterium]